ncbi:TraB/GumN family protein [Zavarzinia compransoris]|uniref:TraB/GumN family protein n=1 Tax=Zavarzinia marina TaxID=2911065 RepID=UPI001F1B4BB7|nr:TraB/GumN family protein [Zavarzinia marina]MCF4167226.1 TraB/GumN family protein [Zavarzinia marina]
MMLRGAAAFLLSLCLFFAAQGPARAEPALWVVRDADSTVYLFGTIHILPADLDWRDARIDAALAASDELWLEADIDNILGSIFSTLRYAINYGIDLDKRLSKEDAARLHRAERRMGMPKGGLNRLRPWLVSMMIETGGQAGDMAVGADGDLMIIAEAAGKEIRFLETLNEQFSLFAGLEPEQELDLLRATLDRMDDAGKAGIPDLIEAWMSGDTDRIYGLFESDGQLAPGGPLYDRVMRQRNVNWVGQIGDLMAGAGTSFIAVGAGHLAGPDSVLVMLEAEGYRIDRIGGEGP